MRLEKLVHLVRLPIVAYVDPIDVYSVSDGLQCCEINPLFLPQLGWHAAITRLLAYFEQLSIYLRLLAA